MKKVNSLKSIITMSVQEKMKAIGKEKISIPFGTLSNIEFFNGRGPKISVTVSLSGGVKTNFKSEFLECGINQTKHKLYLDINSEAFAFIPGGKSVNTAINTSILVAETVIVGEVPNLFAGKL